jgi:sulfotransferase
MHEPTVHYVAGLPRSGSTLLMNLLGQNPAHHVTPTNGLDDMILGNRDSWTRHGAFRAQGLEQVEKRMRDSMRGFILWHYEDELASGKVVFDKGRAWLSALEVLEAIFGRTVPVIVTVRDVRSIVASFERLYRKNPMMRLPFMGQAYYAAQHTQGRAQILLSDSGIIGANINRVRDALHRAPDRCILVPYRQLATDPQRTLAYVHQRLSLAPYTYDPENVKQLTVEDDTLHGWGPKLHQVRQKVRAPLTDQPWADVLTPQLAQQLAQVYADVNRIAALTYGDRSQKPPEQPGDAGMLRHLVQGGQIPAAPMPAPAPPDVITADSDADSDGDNHAGTPTPPPTQDGDGEGAEAEA